MLTRAAALQVLQRKIGLLSIQLAIEEHLQLKRELAAAVLDLVRGIRSWQHHGSSEQGVLAESIGRVPFGSYRYPKARQSIPVPDSRHHVGGQHRLPSAAVTDRTLPRTVDALVPLALLEAVRLVDAPDGDLEAELVPELRNKRLGLSETVYAQVRRYNVAVRRGQRIPFDEAVALAKLVGRRTDAEVVLRSAGRYLANESYARVAPLSRAIMRSVPGMLARPMALRHMRRIAVRYLGGAIARVGSSVLLSVPSSVTLDTGPRETGCSFQEATLRELLKLLVDGAGAVDHVRCASRGEGVCEWRAEWRAVGR